VALTAILSEGNSMKKIEAVIREEQLEAVRAALDQLGHPGMTILSARGHGRQRGAKQHCQGRDFVVDLLHNVKLELVVPDSEASTVVTCIADKARTGDVGDGNVWVTNVESLTRVRTGESGDVAL
jgi:nitrogen regulatory protein P-II 1